MSFEMSIRAFEEMKSSKYPKNIIDRAKNTIQEKFPQEYAEYEKEKDIEDFKKSLINRINSISFRVIFPMGYGIICHLTNEQCSQIGEKYKEKHFDECNNLMVSSLKNDLQEFQKKYPDEFQEFIRKEHMCSDKSEQVTAYFKGIISTIKKEHIKDVVTEEIPKEIPAKPPKKEKVKKVVTEEIPKEIPAKPPKKEKVKKVVTEEIPKEIPAKPPKKEKVKKVVTEEIPKEIPAKPPKKKAVSSAMKKLVWNKTNGEDIGKAKCYCCKSTDITQVSFHCGHVIAESKGGKTIVSNLKPICQNCNSSMGTNDMNDFMKTLE
jgi:hypothetical protein